MSRVGKMPIPVPKGTTVSVQDGKWVVKGPKGQLEQSFDDRYVSVEIDDEAVVVKRNDEERETRGFHGLYRSLLANMVQGVNEPFVRKLEINGVGYRAEVKGKEIALHVGFAGPKTVAIPDGVDVQVEKNTQVTLTSIDKQAVGQLAADIRRVRPPEPYKGKGIKYEEETIRKKAGKAGA